VVLFIILFISLLGLDIICPTLMRRRQTQSQIYIYILYFFYFLFTKLIKSIDFVISKIFFIDYLDDLELFIGEKLIFTKKKKKSVALPFAAASAVCQTLLSGP
jgi:hypothetical protein